jgi:uroporphyrinogen-III synthase
MWNNLVQHLKSSLQNKPLLFPCGKDRRNELPVILRDNSIPLHEIHLYETSIHAEFIERFSSWLSDRRNDMSLWNRIWIAFFSPSAVRAAIPLILEQPAFLLDKLNFVTIGKTTMNEVLLHNVPIRTVCANAPNALELLQVTVNNSLSHLSQ